MTERLTAADLEAIRARLDAATSFNPLPWTSEYDSSGVEINFGPTFKIEDARGHLVFATDSIEECANLLRRAPADLRCLLDEVKRLRVESPSRRDLLVAEEIARAAVEGQRRAERERDAALQDSAAETARLDASRDEAAPTHFAPYGHAATSCGETIPKRMPWNFAAADWDSPAITTRRAETTCLRCLAVFRDATGTVNAPAEDSREYRCPECDRWAPWTDGTAAADNHGLALFWCQTCSAEMPVESMDSRPQESAPGPETPDADTGEGTGVSGPEGCAQGSPYVSYEGHCEECATASSAAEGPDVDGWTIHAGPSEGEHLDEIYRILRGTSTETIIARFNTTALRHLQDQLNALIATIEQERQAHALAVTVPDEAERAAYLAAAGGDVQHATAAAAYGIPPNLVAQYPDMPVHCLARIANEPKEQP